MSLTGAPLQYHSIQPESFRASYSPGDDLDYEITGPGRDLVTGSVRWEADIRVQQSGANVSYGQQIKWDHFTGAHCFVESVRVETRRDGNVENNPEYAKFVAMLAKAQNTPDDMFNSNHVCELRAADEKIITNQIRGVKPFHENTRQDLNQPNDFSIRLLCCLNRADKNVNIDRHGGSIRVTIRLATVYRALYGQNVDANTTITISNARLSFQTVPSARDNSPITFRCAVPLTQSVNSSYTNVSSRVPAIADAVSLVFLQTSRDNAAFWNNQALEQLPNLTRLQFLFNNSQNEAVAYEIEESTEFLKRFVDSLRSSGANHASQQIVSANDAWGLGLAFGELIDLRNQKFNVQFNSGADSTTPYEAFMFFHSIVQA